jgi:zinc D-Ala-D-Ala carboxypeptidase
MKKYTLLVIFPVMLMCAGKGTDEKKTAVDIYAGLDRAAYLSGNYIPSKNQSFVNLDKSEIDSAGKKIYLRTEVYNALVEMSKAIQKDLPGVHITAISTMRSYNDQKSIWNAKWNGLRSVSNKSLKNIKDERQRALEILKYSSMPGTSRHHWGTDIDMNSLNNSYFESGQGKKLYAWLLQNASRFGFSQPYTAGREKGYSEERWHWSYTPLSKQFLSGWLSLYKTDKSFFIKNNVFDGYRNSVDLAFEYVTSINPECK